MPGTTPHRLTDFEMDEGSLVDKGAHPGAKVLIAKRDPAVADLNMGGTPPKEDRKKKRPRRRSATEEGEAGNVREDDPFPAPTSEEEEPMSDEKKLDREALVAKGLDEATADELANYIEGLESYADELESKVSKSDTEDDAPAEEPELEEVIKSLDPSVAELVSKAIQRNDELEERLNTEVSKREQLEDERLTEEYQTVAKSYRHIPVGMDVPEFGEVLKSLAKVDADLYGKVKGVLDKADSALAESGLISKAFEEVGSGSAELTGLGDQAENTAAELVSKGEAPDIETARVMVLENNPELYDATQVPGR